MPCSSSTRVADLSVHLAEAVADDLGIVALGEVAARELARPQLEVGHVDVDDAIHQREAVRAVAGARVVDDRQPQPAVDGKRERLEVLRHDVLGCDPVDVVAAGRLQLEHHVREPLRSRALALQLPRDVVVLAEHAAQVAAAEKIVPEPRRPRRQFSSPKCAKCEATTA